MITTSKSGGIYIEIGGNLTPLKDALINAKVIGNDAAKSISDAFKGAMSEAGAAGVGNAMTRAFAHAKASAGALKTDLTAFSETFRNMGQSIGLAGKDLERFATINAKALQKKNADEFHRSLSAIQRQTGMTNKEMNDLAKSLGGVGNEFSKASKGAQDMGAALKGFAIKAAVINEARKALRSLAEAAVEAFDLAARYETLGVAVQHVGRVAGYSAVEIDKNVNALRQVGIAGIEARQSMTRLIQAQVDITKSSQLARIAQNAAVIGATSSSEAFERMVHGIQSANTQVLRGIGINVNFEQSYRRLAQSLGKSVDELTEQERIQARVNAVTESGERITGLYDAAMETLGKQMGSLKRIQQDFLTDAGKFVLELGKSTGVMGLYANALDSASEAMLRYRAAQMGISPEVLPSGAAPVREAVEGVAALADEAKKLEALFAAAEAKGHDISELRAKFRPLADEITNVGTQITRAKDNLSNLYSMEGVSQELIEQLEAELASLVARQGELTQEVEATRKEYAELGKEAAGTITGISIDTTDFTAQLQKVEAVYGKSADRIKELAIAAQKAQIEAVNALLEAGAISQEAAVKMIAAAQQELDRLTSTGSRGVSAINDRERAIKSLADEIARLTLTEKEYNALRLDQKIAEYAKMGVAAASIQELRLAYEFQEARKSLEDFNRQYQRTFEGIKDVSTAISQEMDTFRASAEIAFKMARISADEYADALQRIAELEQQRQERAYSGRLASAGIGEVGRREDIKKNIETLNEALEKGDISLDRYKQRMREIGLETIRLKQIAGDSTFEEGILLSVSKIAEGFENLNISMTDAFGDFFQSFSQGFADSIGQAIWDMDNFGESIGNVARQAISQLISAFVQMGIQWAVTQVGMTAASVAAQKTTAASATVANAKILSSAAPAAAAQSAATWGTSAVVGAAALAAAIGMMMGAMMKGFKVGGFTGAGSPDEIKGVVHAGEFVLPKPAVDRIGLPALESLRRGSGLDLDNPFAHTRGTASSSAPPILNLSIENYGSSKEFEVQQLSESEIRIIARDEVRKEAPRAVARDMDNPNSITAKSFNRNTNSQRQRP